VTRELTPTEVELEALVSDAQGRVVEAYLEQFGVPIQLERLVSAAVITGMDIGMAFATAFPPEAKVVMGVIVRGAELTEADLAQRSLTFKPLVEAARR
jgi:hypothetical protein